MEKRNNMESLTQYLRSKTKETDNACKKVLEKLKIKHQSRINKSILGKISQSEKDLAVYKERCINDFKLEIEKIQNTSGNDLEELALVKQSAKSQFNTKMKDFITLYGASISNLISFSPSK